MARVLILGAGFGGIATAVALRSELPDADEVVLVDRREAFVMGLRKTWHVLGMSPLAYGERPLAALERRGIRFIRGEITAIDPDARTATVDGDVLPADELVVALGARHAVDEVSGLREHGLDAWTQEGLEHVSGAVAGFRGGRIAIGVFGVPYSCPPGPYELALLLVDRLEARGIDADVTVFAPPPIPLPILGPSGGEPLLRRLDERGITFLGGRAAASVQADRVDFTDGTSLPFDLLLAVPPHRVPPILVEAGLAPADGWVRVDPRTLATDRPGVHAIGDCTAIGLANGMPLPKAGLFAEKEGQVVAARIAASLRGERPMIEFDGVGACFVEIGGGEASQVRGSFLGDQVQVQLTTPTEGQRTEKERFEADRLAAWFGG